MGGVSVDSGGGGGKRSVNAELILIPFIDLLFVTVAFLLITAVWVTNSRINANAQVPGPPDPNQPITPAAPEKILNLHVGTDEFTLSWRQGAVVVSEAKLPKPEYTQDIAYVDLAKKIEEEWKQQGSHKDASDPKLDQAILHVDNRTPYKEIIAVLDALYSPKREVVLQNGKTGKAPAFNMTFSVR